MNKEITCPCGVIKGNVRKNCVEFLGIRYASAGRFEYAVPESHFEGVYDATAFGPCCEQKRAYIDELCVPERRFYYKEFREGLDFKYSEDCLNLNIYTPKEDGLYPVLLFIHGGGFDSMANSEGYLDGEGYAKRGIVLVTINYRVGVFGYLTHEEIYEKYGRDGNFGLDDQITAIKWVKNNIRAFGGNPDRITIMGQSAGAMSVQDICLTNDAKDLIKGAIMISGGGKWPDIASPRYYEKTRDYWKTVISLTKAENFEEFKHLPASDILIAVKETKKLRKDGMLNTMPVVDNFLLNDRLGKLIKKPLDIPYIISITNNDMFTGILARMASKYTREHNAYMYYFDVNAPGDNNEAFHSSDLRYLFGTLAKSHRPYDEKDYELSELMMDYVAAFAGNGNPNGNERPYWKSGKPALCISKDVVKMKRPDWFKLFKNTFKGDPV